MCHRRAEETNMTLLMELIAHWKTSQNAQNLQGAFFFF